MNLNLKPLKTVIDNYLTNQLNENIYNDDMKAEVLNFINNSFLIGYIAKSEFTETYQNSNELTYIKIDELFFQKHNEYTVGLTIHDRASKSSINLLAIRDKHLLLNIDLFNIIKSLYIYNLDNSIIESIHYYKINRFQFSMIKTINNIPIEIIFLKKNINSI